MIKKHADQIREKIKGGTLYGVPIDMNDTDALLVAAHGHARAQAFHQRENERKELESMGGRWWRRWIAMLIACTCCDCAGRITACHRSSRFVEPPARPFHGANQEGGR